MICRKSHPAQEQPSESGLHRPRAQGRCTRLKLSQGWRTLGQSPGRDSRGPLLWEPVLCESSPGSPNPGNPAADPHRKGTLLTALFQGHSCCTETKELKWVCQGHGLRWLPPSEGMPSLQGWLKLPRGSDPRGSGGARALALLVLPGGACCRWGRHFGNSGYPPQPHRAGLLCHVHTPVP